jgi:putative transposase
VIGLEDRQRLAALVQEACAAGAPQHAACELAGIDERSLQRWKSGQGLRQADARATAVRPAPAHRLSPEEIEQVLSVLNEPRFADKPPAFIVATLADEDVYIASEASFYRIMRKHGQNKHRGRARAGRPQRAPSTHVATAPKQLWCWDMTYLPSPVKGQFFYLYMILDVFSRKIVGWEVHERDSAEHAADLLKRTTLAEGIAGLTTKPVLHGDNGATLKATTVLAMLHWLGIAPSYSRPRVSNDNAYAESLFRTAKYRPEFPAQGMRDLAHARQWAHDFVHWYNQEHLHSGIGWVTPAARHVGQDKLMLEHRREVYAQARERNRQRWSRHARQWKHQAAVTLNPERDSVVEAAVAAAAQAQHSAPTS